MNNKIFFIILEKLIVLFDIFEFKFKVTYIIFIENILKFNIFNHKFFLIISSHNELLQISGLSPKKASFVFKSPLRK